MRDVEALKLRFQSETLARWWKVGADYEAQAFWMSAADILDGQHTLEVPSDIAPGQVVAIRNGESGGRLLFGSEATRAKFMAEMKSTP